MIKDFANEFIAGTQYQRIADYIIGPDRQDRILPSNTTKVVWCRPDFLDLVFNQCSSVPESKFILITHCSDYEINKIFFDKKPSNIIKWFAQNVTYEHPDLHCIPIGLESNSGPYRGAYTDFNWLFNNVAPEPVSNKIINKIYCNFNLRTHSNRRNVLEKLQQNDICFLDVGREYKAYCEKVKEFLFIASPRGNGLDCHRTWETLYLGSIPIVEESFSLREITKGLPVLFVKDWNDEMELQEKMSYFKNLYKNGQAFVNTERLNITYWCNKINSFR